MLGSYLEIGLRPHGYARSDRSYLIAPARPMQRASLRSGANYLFDRDKLCSPYS